MKTCPIKNCQYTRAPWPSKLVHIKNCHRNTGYTGRNALTAIPICHAMKQVY